MKLTNKILLGTFILILLALLVLLIIIKIQIKKELTMTNNKAILPLTFHSKELYTANFKNIKITTSSNIRVVNSKSYKLVTSGHKAILNNLKITISNNNLVISSKKNISAIAEKLTVTIFAPYIKKIEVLSPSCINIENFLLNSLEISIHEAGKITGLNNHIKNLKIVSTGIGNIDFKNSSIVNAILNLSGENRVEINMDGGVLNGNIKGTSAIIYHGKIKDNKIKSSGTFYIVKKQKHLSKSICKTNELNKFI